MRISTSPYLKILRSQLATSLWPKQDEAAQKIALYNHRILTQLLIDAEKLPALQAEALSKFDTTLDALCSELCDAKADATLIAGLGAHIRGNPDFDAAEPLLQQAVRVLVDHGSTASLSLAQQISAIVLAIQDSIHTAARADELQLSAANAPDAEPLTGEQKRSLQRCLLHRFPDETALTIGKVKDIVGGGSKQTLFVDLLGTAKLPREIVLRVDRAGSPVGSNVKDEFGIIGLMHEAGMPVPKPYALETDQSVLGAPFIVMSRIEGCNIGDAIDANDDAREQGRSCAVSVAQCLGRMHAIPIAGAALQLPGAEMSTRERMLQNLDDFEGRWRALRQPFIAMEMGFAWMRDHMDYAEGGRAIAHCDVGFHNMLFKDGQLAALLDWETVVVGNPAQDLGYAYHSVVQLMPWKDFLDEYRKAGGTIPRTGEVDFYRLWRALWVMVIQLVTRDWIVNETNRDLIIAYSSQYWYQRCNHNLHQVVDLVYSRRY